MEPMQLTLTNVKKHFGDDDQRVDVLRGVSFSISSGQSLAITGPSGSGKSTLLHLVGTLDSPSSGSIRIGEHDPFSLLEPDLARFRNRTIGFVFQDHYLLPQYTVLENTVLPALAYSGGEDPIPRAQELLDRVGLSPRLGHKPAQLSGGERQRVAIARALINRAALLLCDEPTGNLDHENANGVISLLLELHGQRDAGNEILIVVTHSLEVAGRLARHLKLCNGRSREE